MAKLMVSTKTFLIKCRRVWHALRKPTRTEYEQVAKISALGIVLLGIIGFLVSLVMKAFV
ncbi:MAG: protein translocase SEC61 complex subunit gamma [archaeon]